VTEREIDTRCPVNVSINEEGNIIKGSTGVHTQNRNQGRVEASAVRDALLSEATRRPEAAPASLLN